MMSKKAIDWALSVKKISWQSKMLLVALAAHHDEETGLCTPSRSQLAEMCNAKKSWVQFYFKELFAAGLMRSEPVSSDTSQNLPSRRWFNFDISEPLS